MKKKFKKLISPLVAAVIGGIVLLFITSAVNGWNDTLVKKEWILKEFLTSKQISEHYVNKIEYAILDGKISILDEKLDILLAYNGLVYDKKEECPFPPCICPNPPCPKKKKVKSKLVQNDTDLEGF